jgi:Zn-dependent peptidase ImmA (M78 family)
MQSIKEAADGFRLAYWGNIIPVDIEKILETKLDMSIIPVPELSLYCDTDALITSDWTTVIVDNAKYSDQKYLNRLRFSIAHEIGHYVLHQDFYSSLEIQTTEDFYNFINQLPGEQYAYLETQANKFANFLLVPREILFLEKEKILQAKGVMADFLRFDDETLNSYIAGPLSTIFGVSSEVVEIALK